MRPMSATRNLLALVLLLWAAGCSTSAAAMNNLRIGMSYNQVIGQLGQPNTLSAQGEVTVARYWLWEPSGGHTWYFVKLVGDKVTSFGRMGDFDSTKDPTLNLNVNEK